MCMVKKSNAQVFLLLNAILWGSSYVWSKMLLAYFPGFTILFLNSLGSLIATATIFPSYVRKIKKDIILPCVLVSFLSIISNTLSIFALKHTSSANTAFIVQLSVIITPVIAAFLDRKHLEAGTVTSALIAFAGVFVMTRGNGELDFNIGDALAFGNAVFFSAFVAFLSRLNKRVEPIQFTIIHHTINTAAFSLLALFIENSHIRIEILTSPRVSALVAASIFVSAVTILIQSTAIKYVRPERTTVIYTIEPAAALAATCIFNSEKVAGIRSVVGFALITLSVISTIYKPRAAAVLWGRLLDGMKIKKLIRLKVKVIIERKNVHGVAEKQQQYIV